MNNYHTSIEWLTSSQLKKFAVSPLHFKHWADNPEEEKSDAMTLGTQVHNLLDGVDNAVIFEPDNRPKPEQTFAQKDNKEWKEKFYTEFPEAITFEDDAKARKMVASIQGSNFYKGLEKLSFASDTEEVFQAVLFGQKCKCRVDKIYKFDENTILIVDWKTTRKPITTDYWQYKRMIESTDYGYSISMVHYCEILKELTGKNVVFCFVFVSNTEPYDVMPVYVTPDTDCYDTAFIKWSTLLQKAKWCIDNQIFEGATGYSYEIATESDSSRLDIIKKYSSIKML